MQNQSSSVKQAIDKAQESSRKLQKKAEEMNQSKLAEQAKKAQKELADAQAHM